MKKILWWNLGHIFFWNPLNWLKFLRKERMDCYFRPKNGKKISDWVKKEDFDVITFGEIEKPEDMKYFDLPDHTYTDWIHSQYHIHGRCILSKLPFIKITEKIEGIVMVGYEFEDYVLIPVHLHFSSTHIRLLQIMSYLMFIDQQNKPVFLAGDFNIWCINGTFQLWKGDEMSYILLKENLHESSEKITTTEILPGFKLDYLFVSPVCQDAIICQVPKNFPHIQTDHKPIEFMVNIKQ